MTKHDLMGEALKKAAEAGFKGEIPVGAVIAYNGEIVSSSCNSNRAEKNPLRHAEMIAIERACSVAGNERLIGMELFVTKEPCAMCAGAIIHARIDKIYIGTRDEKYGACGTVFDILGNKTFNHCPEIEFGIMEIESRELLKKFFMSLRKRSDP